MSARTGLPIFTPQRCHNRIIPTAIAHILNRGRRRILTQLGWSHLATALAVVFGAAILLLLLGTALFSWYWLPLLFAAGIGTGLWRLLREAPSVYQVAQRIDHALELHDSLSTAFHYGTTTEPALPLVKEAQSRQAEEVARSVNLQAALPFRTPRTAYIAGALGLVALTLVGIRYGVTQSLDFRPSLVAMAFENFFTGSNTAALKDKRGPLPNKNFKDEFEKMGVQVNTADQKMSDLDPGRENSTDVVDTPDVNADPGSNDSKTQSKLDPQQMKAEGDESAGDKEGAQGGENTKGKDDQQPEAGDGKNEAGKDAPDKQGQQQKGDNSSLLDKLKDAMSNMLNKMKMQQKGDQQQQKQENASKEGASSQQAQKNSQQSGEQDKQGQQAQGEGKDQKSDAKDGQKGQKSENAQGKSSEQKANQQQSADNKSGMGKQDGAKDLKDAELQQAMGKISEIFGKRQQNLTGEITIEVSSGKQQLKTSYSGKTASHKESGGEITRDEVPVIYQQYVEKYFDQIRKADAAADRAATSGQSSSQTAAPAAPPKPASPGGVKPTSGASN